MQVAHKNKVFVKQQSLDQSENNVVQVNNLEQDLIDLGFQTGQILFEPKVESSKALVQTIVVKDNKNKSIHVHLNTQTFKKVKLYLEKSNQQLSALNQPIINQNENLCKICLSKDEPEKLIKPCQCRGSVQYVHEDCLKTWLLRGHNIDEIRANRVQCELCKTIIKCEVYFQSQYIFQQLLRIQTNQKCCLISFFIISLFLYAIGILMANFLNNNQYTVAFIIGIVLCFFVGVIIQLLLAALIIEIITIVTVSSWKILQNVDSISSNHRIEKQKSMKKSDSVPVFTIKEDFMIKTLTKQQTNADQII